MNTDRSKLLAALFDETESHSPDVSSLNNITEAIIGCAYKVGNTLGCGFLEKVYENALCHEMRKACLHVKQQHEISVFYDDLLVGSYCADLLVENLILIELKAVKELNDVIKAQCLNYLRATNLRICLLINFGSPRVEIKRIML
jgi:GxxExxY protein